LRGASARPWRLALPAPPIRLNSFAPRVRLEMLLFFLLWAPAIPRPATAADRLILRNLELIADRTVTAVDEDGILLDKPRAGGSDRLTWDEIERGRVAPELQGDFNRLKDELGPPLFKLRQRLRIGDYAGLLAPAEELYPRFAPRQSQTAYLVCQSLMWGRLASGEREAAVEPFLRCVDLLAREMADPRRLPGPRRLLMDDDSPLCGDLPPVWLDRQAAQEVLPAVQSLIKEMPMPRPAEAYIYYASLAATAGEFDEATKVLDAIGDESGGARHARDVIRGQIQVERGRPASAVALEAAEKAGPSAVLALARYWRGLGSVAAKDADQKRDGLLSLLSIPANDKGDQAELAACALHQSAAALAALGDAGGAAAVRRELVTRYGATAVGVQTQSVGKSP
jgi:hypothetical protein